MQYKIIVDKQTRTNPSSNKRQYVIDIEELRYLGDIYDSLIITKESDYVIRRLSLSEYGVLSVLDKEVIEPIDNINIELFEGENYIYLADMTGNYIYAEYLLKNEFTDMYITEAEMNTAIKETYNSIELSVNQKLTSYSTIEELIKAKNEAIDEANTNTYEELKKYPTTAEMNSAIELSAKNINIGVNEKLTSYSTVEQTNSAKQEAINEANSNTENQLNNYSTKEETETAKQNAINSANSSTDNKLQNYTTLEETNNAKQEAIDSANNSTDEKLKEYSTTVEMKSEIELESNKINLEVAKKLNSDEFSTKLQLDYESVQIAWNKISEFIKFINAQLQIKDSNKKLLMALDKTGQHFYSSDEKLIGDIGLIKENGTNKIAFTINGVDGTNQMAWGIKYNDKFIPVFWYEGNNKTSDTEAGGMFHLEAPLIMQEKPIYLGQDENGSYIQGLDNGSRKSVNIGNTEDIYITDSNGNEILAFNNGYLKLGELLETGLNIYGNYSFDLKDNYIINVGNMATTDGIINYFAGSSSHLYVGTSDGGGFTLYPSSSDNNLKKNIKDTEVNALDLIKKIKHKQFDWKTTNEHQDIGYIAQEMQEIDKSFVHHNIIKDKEGKEKEDWQINILSVLATTTKALQEQQETIENQQKTIDNLLKRIERLEEKNGIN